MAVWLAEGESVRDIAEATVAIPGSQLLAPEADLPQSLSRQADLVRLVLSLAELG